MKIKINETLLELMLGIALWGIFWLAAGIWFVPEKLSCGLGLLIGALTAELCAVHMYRSLDRALDLQEKDAQKYMMTRNMFRYGLILVILGILMVTEFANPLCGFLGIIGLKAAAYMQPFVHKILGKLKIEKDKNN